MAWSGANRTASWSGGIQPQHRNLHDFAEGSGPTHYPTQRTTVPLSARPVCLAITGRGPLPFCHLVMMEEGNDSRRTIVSILSVWQLIFCCKPSTPFKLFGSFESKGQSKLAHRQMLTLITVQVVFCWVFFVHFSKTSTPNPSPPSQTHTS